jgi:hypothetical protein
VSFWFATQIVAPPSLNRRNHPLVCATSFAPLGSALTIGRI